MEPQEEMLSDIQRTIVKANFYWNGQHWIRAPVFYLPLQGSGQDCLRV